MTPARPRPPRRAGATGRLAAAAAIAALAAVTVACSSGEQATPQATTTAASTPAIDGLRTYEVTSANHTTEPVTYDQTPPVGGDHAPVWQNCGAYPAPIPTESGVHSMEHGAVWIVYGADADEATRSALETRARNGTYLLVSPWDGELPAPIVASAWGAQLSLDSADDPRLDAFITAYRQALTAPEPGAPCTGGNATTR